MTQLGGSRWLVSLDGGQLLMVEGELHLQALIAQGAVTSATPVYEIGPFPRALGDVPGLARFLPRQQADASPMGGDSDAVAKLNDEIAVLDQPVEEEIEYYDERPARSGPRAGVVGFALAVLCGSGLLLALHNPRTDLAIGRLVAGARAALPFPAVAAASAGPLGDPPIEKPTVAPAPPIVAAAVVDTTESLHPAPAARPEARLVGKGDPCSKAAGSSRHKRCASRRAPHGRTHSRH